MAIICAPRLCLRDIKLFTGIIGFYSEQISTCAHTRAHKKTKCVSFICPQFSVFAVGTREEGVEGVFLCTHLRQPHIHARPCIPPTMIKVFLNKVIKEQVCRVFIGPK